MCRALEHNASEGKTGGGGDENPAGHHKHSRMGAGRNWQGDWPNTPGRLIGTGLIRLYQVTLSSLIGNSCRHMPTCSEYGYEAVAKHGLWAGFWMALFRFARCGPGGPGQTGVRGSTRPYAVGSARKSA